MRASEAIHFAAVGRDGLLVASAPRNDGRDGMSTKLPPPPHVSPSSPSASATCAPASRSMKRSASSKTSRDRRGRCVLRHRRHRAGAVSVGIAGAGRHAAGDPRPQAFRGMTLAWNCSSTEEVDQVLDFAISKGASLLKPAHKTFTAATPDISPIPTIIPGKSWSHPASRSVTTAAFTCRTDRRTE